MKNALLVLLSLLCMNVQAQEAANFTVSVSRDSVLIGNYLEVTFTLENAKGSSFKAPGFNGFEIISGPNSSSRTSIINGRMSSSTSYSYYVEPRFEGSIYIDPASIEVDGSYLETEPVEILVAPNPEGIIEEPAQQRMDSFFDGFGFPEMERTFPSPFNQPQERQPRKKKRRIYKI